MRSTTPERLAMCRGEKPAPYKQRFVPALAKCMKAAAAIPSAQDELFNFMLSAVKHPYHESNIPLFEQIAALSREQLKEQTLQLLIGIEEIRRREIAESFL